MADVSFTALAGDDANGVPLALAVGQALFLWALDPMMLTRPDTGAILDANPAACAVLGLSVEEIRRRGRKGLQDPDDPRWAAGVRRRASTGSFAGELSMRRGDGTPFPAESTSGVFEVGGVQYAVLIFRDVTEQRSLERRLREAVDEMSRLATADDLTGLLNRRGFMTVGDRLAEQAHRERQPFVVLAVDVDGLKQVNDRHGHAIGDDMLGDTAATLTATLRSADVIARIGGDEFAVVLAGAHAPADAAFALDRLDSHLAEATRRKSRPYRLTVSVGVATGVPGRAFTLEGLMRIADEAMYADKRSRRYRAATIPDQFDGRRNTSST